ncbi:hypothetical protein [Pseudomonas sp. LBUM920]|uniref:hypothetical protein n=1 Tax=Pseudomonas sp. LBUM920 TaxID=2126069 RepID=UPI000F58EDAF|nr:hypothetical protein [Pseudomonas sp. LBUM920]AZF61729.1 hypothetical protein C4J83_0717 [Pseudomonas sp. LBUM920]
MPISLEYYDHPTLCHGQVWTITDENLLAEQIARVAMGQSRHVQKIIAGTNVGPPASRASAAQGAIGLLTVPAGEDPWHRDGWIFQVISWIAAQKADPNALIRPPQMIHALKGFDGLRLELSGGEVVAATIFEDKATDDARKTVRDLVWPEFRLLDQGDKENVLVAEVVALLETNRNVDPDLAIENIIWKNIRHYRVSITVGKYHSTSKGRVKLFKDYDKVIDGKVSKRGGEVFYIEHLRPWMSSLAEKSIAHVNNMVAAHV